MTGRRRILIPTMPRACAGRKTDDRAPEFGPGGEFYAAPRIGTMHDSECREEGRRGHDALLRHLNPEQLAAVTLPAEPALILAGAGSGKTRVLTTRIAWLLQTGQVSPGGVLAVTFTNKAAKEMLTRLSAMLPVNVRGMWIGTFHGLCNRFLRAHWKLAGLAAGFQILDSADQLSAVKRVIKGMNLDEERFVPKQVTLVHRRQQGRRPAPERHRGARRADAQAGRDLPGLRGPVPARGRGRLRRADAAHLRAAARQRPAARALPAPLPPRAGRRVPGHQPAAVPLAADVRAAGHAARACSRSATTTRASTPSAARTSATWPTSSASTACGTSSSWSRTTARFGNILDAANELIAHNAKRLGKNLRTDAGPGEPVRVVEATSDFAEAQWFLDEAQQLHRGGTPRTEIALLYRSNAQSRVMESALFNAGMPYRVYGGLRFFERAEVKHALAYLRLLENPNDDTSFLRVVNFPARGIGARTIELLQDAARASGRSLYQSVGAVAGKGGGNLPASTRWSTTLRDARAAPDAARDHRARAAALGAGRLLPRREGRPGPHREPGRTGQRRRGLRHAGRASARTRWRCRSTSTARHRAAWPAAEARRRRRDRRDHVAAGRLPHPRRARGRRQPGPGRARTRSS